eukprot:174242-Chlamydomonas_euryale.AAC.1
MCPLSCASAQPTPPAIHPALGFRAACGAAWRAYGRAAARAASAWHGPGSVHAPAGDEHRAPDELAA